MSPRSPRIVDLVFARGDRHTAMRIAFASFVTAFVYASGGVGAWIAQRLAPAPRPVQHTELAVDMTPPPPPVHHDPPPPPPPVHHDPPPSTAVKVASALPPPPAQAGQIVGKEADPSEPADLTGNTFVTGTARAYAGGVTKTNGTNDTAVHTRDTDPKGKPGARDHSRPVSLPDPDWSCPWPREADAEQIDEQTAIVRVVVTSNGVVQAASVVTDPGFGFGAAAVECARTTHFDPARDREGNRVSSQSPPIRVRFTR